MSIKKIVIVDDNEDMRLLISRTLEKDERLSVEAEADDAREAVEVIRRVQPDVIILDHYLKGRVMGLESAPVLKTLCPDSKVIVFTEKDLGFEAYLEPEVDAYLQKGELSKLRDLICGLLDLPPEDNAV